MRRGVRQVDDAALRALADPECAPALDAAPELTMGEGLPGLRRTVAARLAADPAPALPVGVHREVRADGTRVHTPVVRAEPRTAVLWVHGGGLVAGEPRQDDVHCAAMALADGCQVLAPAYRLAPEHPYPAALDDCVRVLHALLATDVRRVVVAGTSAGGGLALAVGLSVRDPRVVGLQLLSPMLDDRPGRPSAERLTALRTWHRDANAAAWAAYTAGLTRVPATCAPGRADVDLLRGLPPVYLDVGTLDPFLDEDLELARRLALADVPVELLVTPGAFHGSEVLAPAAASSQRIWSSRSRWRTAALCGTPTPPDGECGASPLPQGVPGRSVRA